VTSEHISYRSAQEQLVREINNRLSSSTHTSRTLLLKLRITLLDEQLNLTGPTFAFIAAKELLSQETYK